MTRDAGTPGGEDWRGQAKALVFALHECRSYDAEYQTAASALSAASAAGEQRATEALKAIAIEARHHIAVPAMGSTASPPANGYERIYQIAMAAIRARATGQEGAQ